MYFELGIGTVGAQTSRNREISLLEIEDAGMSVGARSRVRVMRANTVVSLGADTPSHLAEDTCGARRGQRELAAQRERTFWVATMTLPNLRKGGCDCDMLGKAIWSIGGWRDAQGYVELAANRAHLL